MPTKTTIRDLTDKFLIYLDTSPAQAEKLPEVIQMLETVAGRDKDIYRETAAFLNGIHTLELPPPNPLLRRQAIIFALKQMLREHKLADAYIEADNLDGLRLYWSREVARYEKSISDLINILKGSP